MVHVKLIVVDDTFVSVGSGNFDDRSIRLNDEANLDVLDSQFAAQQMRLFELDKKQSHEMGLDKTGFYPLQQAARLAPPQL
jgi:cardiolipin synthase